MTVCKGCQGDVRNVPGRRLTVEQLMAVHRASCPAGRVRAAHSEPTTKDEMLVALGSALRMPEGGEA